MYVRSLSLALSTSPLHSPRSVAMGRTVDTHCNLRHKSPAPASAFSFSCACLCLVLTAAAHLHGSSSLPSSQRFYISRALRDDMIAMRINLR
jgi:hypothetical protein